MTDSDLITIGQILGEKPGAPIEHPAIHSPGVFFGLPEEEYHAAFALSASGVKHLRISSLDFWARSVLNPLREEDESEALTVGSAYHRRILEGRDRFYAEFAPRLDKSDFPKALDTNEQMIEALAQVGVKMPKGTRKAELIAALKVHLPNEQIWQEVLAEHEAEHEGKTFLPADVFPRIEIAAAMIEKSPTLSKAFTGGYPEVSAFWTDHATGVPMKVRFDYLKPRAIVDLKTFENVLGMPINKAIARAVASNKYHIQAAQYLAAARHLPALISAGDVYGDVEQDFLDALVASEGHTFLFVFQQKGVAPLARGKVLDASITLDMARAEIEDAARLFAECWQIYGADPWLDRSEIETFDATDFPAFIAD